MKIGACSTSFIELYVNTATQLKDHKFYLQKTTLYSKLLALFVREENCIPKAINFICHVLLLWRCRWLSGARNCSRQPRQIISYVISFPGFFYSVFRGIQGLLLDCRDFFLHGPANSEVCLREWGGSCRRNAKLTFKHLFPAKN